MFIFFLKWFLCFVIFIFVEVFFIWNCVVWLICLLKLGNVVSGNVDFIFLFEK